MNLPIDRELGLRKAALALHALQDADRQWLLGALPAAHRHQLLPLLSELEALALPPDAEVIRQVLAKQPPQRVASPEPSASQLTPDMASALARKLLREAPKVQRMLLAALPYSDRHAVLLLCQSALSREATSDTSAALAPALKASVERHWRNTALQAEVPP